MATPTHHYSEHVKFPQLKVLVYKHADGGYEVETIDAGGIGYGETFEEAMQVFLESLDALYQVAQDENRPMQSQPREEDLAAYEAYSRIGQHELGDGRTVVLAFPLNRVVNGSNRVTA